MTAWLSRLLCRDPAVYVSMASVERALRQEWARGWDSPRLAPWPRQRKGAAPFWDRPQTLQSVKRRAS